VADVAATEAWYRDVLGLPHLFSFGNLTFFDAGGTRLYLEQGEVKPESILYFRVGDIHATARALEDKGDTIVSAPHMIHRHEDGTEEWMAFFNDLEGRPLALMASVKPG
jgi:catechol 2,3-dioxygenase-like lactoylglutathione lyase family enzyme